MELSIISIGNSKGVRLSKALLEHYQISDKVELVLEKDHFIVKPISKTRAGWSKAFEAMQREGGDQLLIDDVFEEEDFEEWS